MTRPVTTTERAAMRAERRQGVPERTIARHFGRALQTVQRHVGDLPSSSALVAQPGRLSPQARIALSRAIADGMPATRAALRFGISAHRARAIAKEA